MNVRYLLHALQMRNGIDREKGMNPIPAPDGGADEEFSLRLLEERDTEDLFKLLAGNYEYLSKWMPFGKDALQLSDAKAYINDGHKQYLAYAGVHFGIFLHSQLAGFISYRKADWANRIISLGYWIDASRQGRGLATKACRLLTDLAFNGLGMNRVEIACATENSKSQAVAKRLGFCREGVIRDAEYVNGRYVDHVIYGMLAREWAGRSVKEQI